MQSASNVLRVRWSIAREAIAVAIVGAVLSILWTLTLGPDVSFDFLAYHLFIGMHASGDALANSYFPSGESSYLLPYAHWPLSAMIAAQWPSRVIGIVWSTIESSAVLATWFVAYALFPGRSARDVLLRILGTILGMLSPLALAAIGSSHVDLITAVPVVVGLAILLVRIDRPERRFAWMLLAGACFGTATALKLTNATMSLAAGAMVACVAAVRRDVGVSVVIAVALGGIVGATLTYGYWGWLLWREFGNPMYPFFDSLFYTATSAAAGTTEASGATAFRGTASGAGAAISERVWTFRNGLHQRFLPHDWAEWLLRPLYMIDPNPNVYVEVRAPDARFLALLLLAPLALLLPGNAVGGDRHAPSASWTLGRLLTFTLFGWLLWLMLFGNGRYMLPIALMSGPALVECLRRLFWRRPTHAIAWTVVLIAVQAILMMEGSFRWTESPWRQKWVEAVLPESVMSRPATFVIFGGFPASWLTLFVHPASRFVFPDALSRRPRIADRLPKLLSKAELLVAVFNYHAVDEQTGRPLPATPKALAQTAKRYGLVVDFDACEVGRLIGGEPNATLLSSEDAQGRISRRRMVTGYFFCPAHHNAALMPRPLDPIVEAAFDNLEHLCPQEMPARTTETVCTADGCSRRYPTTDALVQIDTAGNVTVHRFGGFDKPSFGKASDLARSSAGVNCHSDVGRYTPFEPGGNVLSRPPNRGR